MSRAAIIDKVHDLFQMVNGVTVSKTEDPALAVNSLNYEPVPGDRVLVTIPRSGTWWTLNMILSILRAEPLVVLDVHMYLKYQLKRRALYRPEDRTLPTSADINLIHTHRLLRYGPDAKYLLVVRNQKDTCVSMYYCLRKTWKMEFTFNDFFGVWMDAGPRLPNHDYFRDVSLLWERRSRGNCTLITYEEMVANPRDNIVRIAAFLGQKYVDRLYDRCDGAVGGGGDDTCSSSGAINTTDLLDSIIKGSSIKSMRSRPNLDEFHIRKGVVGDWRAVMSRDESDLIDQRVKDEWMGTGLVTVGTGDEMV